MCSRANAPVMAAHREGVSLSGMVPPSQITRNWCLKNNRNVFLLMQARRPKSRYQQGRVPLRHSGEKLFWPLQPVVDQFPQSMAVAMLSPPLISAGLVSSLRPSGSNLLHMKTPGMGRRAHPNPRQLHMKISSYVCQSPISETGHCLGHICAIPRGQNLSISDKFRSHVSFMSCDLPGNPDFTWQLAANARLLGSRPRIPDNMYRMSKKGLLEAAQAREAVLRLGAEPIQA